MFRVTCDNTNDDAIAIFSSGRLPNKFDSHPSFSFATARDARVRADSKSPFIHIVTIEYSTEPVRQEQRDRESFINPLDRPARVSGQAAQGTKVPVKGYKLDSNFVPASELTPIQNAAYDDFTSLPEIDDSVWVISVTKNYNPLPVWLFDMNNTTNQSDVVIYGRNCPRGTLKLSGMRFSELQQEQGVWFYEVTFEVHFRNAFENDSSSSPQISSQSQIGWAYTLTNRGFNQLVGGDITKKEKIRNKNDNNFPSVPQLLNADGSVIPDPTATKATFISWMVYPESDFSVLPIIPLPPG
jgi:hypothetical protein